MSVGRAEWVLVPEACCLAAAATYWTLHIARGLRVNPDRMRDNLERSGGLILSEAVMLRLGTSLGRNAAHDVVYEAAMAAFDSKGTFRDLLLADARVSAALSSADVEALLDPSGYTGLAGAFVDRVVAQVRRLG